ncbi:MAG: hypothetical protein QOK29_1304 [Rhodospirillaceae bacterium]|nr:hypothetical protein [Rhodospirillaceae bacterium]
MIPGKISASDIARFLQARVVLRAPRDKTVPSHLRNRPQDQRGSLTRQS